MISCISVVSAEDLVMDDKLIVVSENESDDLPFIDISTDFEYYDSIKYVYDRGGLSNSDYFRPYDSIKRAEVFTIIEKLWGDPENLPKTWDGWSGTSTYNQTWNYDRTMIKDDYFETCSKNLAAHLIMGILDIDPIMYVEWAGLSNSVYNTNYYNTLIIFGLNGEDLEYEYEWQALNRVDFCRIVEFVDKNKNNFKVPFDLKEETGLTFQFEKFEKYPEYNLNNIKCGMLDYSKKIPQNILDKFIKQRYKIKVFPSEVKANYWFTEEVAGMFIGDYKEIRIVSYGVDAFIHEMGHYVGYCKPKYEIDLWKFKDTEEYEDFRRLVGRSYYTTDKYEYFAEVFSVYIMMPEELKEVCPMTYEYMDKAIKEFK